MKRFAVLIAALLVGCESVPAQVETRSRALIDELLTSRVVEGYDCPPTVVVGNSMELDGSAIAWLCSRTHFRNDAGLTTVGHDMLMAAVREVYAMRAELERLRGAAARAAPDPVLGDAGLLDLNCFYEKLKDRSLSSSDVMGACTRLVGDVAGSIDAADMAVVPAPPN
jgi:hypothetical protein